MAKIYTKVGDRGETSLVGGQKISKGDLRIETYGTVDELNSALGVCRCLIAKETNSELPRVTALAQINADLETLQHWLFDLGSLLAALPEDREKFSLPKISMDHVLWLEKRIDSATAVLKPLKNFILPSGSEPSCYLQMARTIARRAERHMVQIKDELPENSIPFLNRVSDYLFTLARYVNYLLGCEETAWKHAQPAMV